MNSFAGKQSTTIMIHWKTVRLSFGYWLTWILIFQLARMAFVLYQWADSSSTGFSTIMQSFWYGARMDASMAAYILLPVCLLLLLAHAIPFFRKPITYYWYNRIISLPILMILFADLPAYRAWGFRMDASPLKYLVSPREAWASVSHLPVVWILLAYILVYLVMTRTLNRYISNSLSGGWPENRQWVSACAQLLCTVALVLPIRGGWQLAPLNQSSVYFSTKQFANLTAINPVWNFMHSLSHLGRENNNEFVYMDPAKAGSITKDCLRTSWETALLTDSAKHPKPNIILVIWESFTAKAVDQKWENVDISPGFNQLKKEGIYFSQAYATGDRTDKGMTGILSGYPAQPLQSIIKIPQKSSKLPNIVRDFSQSGYRTSFYYGGELEFANMKSYLLNSGFQRMTSKDDFAGKDQNSKWGAHDHVVKEKIVSDLKQEKEPFFITWLTLSSHEPYETPVPAAIPGKKDVNQFLNSIHYTDSVVSAFIRYCEQQPWWNNTLLFVVADHGHRLPYTQSKAADFHIPLLVLGGALRETKKEVREITSQTDIAGLILTQAGLPANEYQWSKNPFQGRQGEWAFFTFNNGFGLMLPERSLVIDNVSRLVIEQSGKLSGEDIDMGKALQQQSMEDFLRR